jgi:hypothetical protein
VWCVGCYMLLDLCCIPFLEVQFSWTQLWMMKLTNVRMIKCKMVLDLCDVNVTQNVHFKGCYHVWLYHLRNTDKYSFCWFYDVNHRCGIACQYVFAPPLLCYLQLRYICAWWVHKLSPQWDFVRLSGATIFNRETTGASNASDMINDRKYDATTCPKKMIAWKWQNRRCPALVFSC